MPQRFDVSLGFMPAFFLKHVGITYGTAYYFDPEYRAQIDCMESKCLYEMFGAYGVGNSDPSPSSNLFIQPIDLFKLTQGAELVCPDDATLESRGNPWAHLTPDEIARLDVRSAAEHPIIDTVIAQFRVMELLYGDRADLFSLKSGMLNIHTPYTTAHQLCGERLFLLMLDDPAAATQIFHKIWDIYQALLQRLCTAIDAPWPQWVQLNDCSACLLSSTQYRESVLPVNTEIARTYADVGYHSCGPSTHLLESIRQLPHVRSMEIGPGTDLTSTADLFPGIELRPLINPVLMRDETPEGVEMLIGEILHATEIAPAVTLCAWSFDRDTPIANVRSLFDTVQRYQSHRR